MSLASEPSISTIETRVTEVLRDLGFGVHETSVIIALNQLTSVTVSDLHNATGIHHANLYSVLEGLISRGLVVSNEGRPREYQFAPLNHLEDTLSTKVSQLIDGLKKIQEERTSQGTIPALIYTIRGKQEVLSKILSMVNRAEERVLLVGPDIHILEEVSVSALRDAANRGVMIRAILGTPFEKPDFRIQQRIKEDTLAINLVADGKEAMIAIPDLSVCGWADNILISLQFEGFLEQAWNNARMM